MTLPKDHALHLQPAAPAPPELPPNRGRLLTPADVAAIVGRSEAWCRRNVLGKLALGRRTVRWWEADVLAWLEAQRAV